MSGRAHIESCLLLSLCLSCSARSVEQADSVPSLGAALGSSVAAPGRTRLFIGQDVQSIENYAARVSKLRGLVSYTSVQGLEGLASPQDNGGGVMHLSRLTAEYPDVPIALGLYLVDALDAINAGVYDASLERLGSQLAEYHVPILLRVGYEFDGDWNHYDPEAYKSAFVRVRAHVASRAPNVEYVWHGAASCGGTSHPTEDWYPGDEAVDWVGVSFFAQADCQFGSVKHLLFFARRHQKPFMIAEAAPQGFDLSDLTYSKTGFDRASTSAAAIYDDWYAPYFGLVADNLDVVRAASYINADWDSQRMWAPPYQQGYFGDSRVQANAELLSRWQRAIGAEHFE